MPFWRHNAKETSHEIPSDDERPRGTGDWDIFKWPRKDIEAHLAYWERLNHELREAGELVSVEALAAPAEAKRVRADKNGLPVTDGVFPETKEFLAGYWIIDVDSAERAYAIAARGVDGAGAGGQAVALGARGASGDASSDAGRVTSTRGDHAVERSACSLMSLASSTPLGAPKRTQLIMARPTWRSGSPGKNRLSSGYSTSITL